MEPLRLELDESTALRLQAAPQAVKDDVEQHHNRLLGEVRQIYLEKQTELREYTDRKISESAADPADSPKLPAESARPPVKFKNIKSIVKRRPSRSGKRVSFSNCPPQVELFRTIDEHDDENEHDLRGEEAIDSSSDDQQTKNPATSSTRRPGLSSSRTASSKYKMNNFKLPKPYLKMLEPPESDAQTPNGSNSNHTEEELFKFEDVIGSPTLGSDPDTSVDSHRAKYTPENSPPALLPRDDPTDMRNGQHSSSDEVLTGSAPVNIRTNRWGVEADYGPPPLLQKEKWQEEDEQLVMSLEQLDLPSSMDPSQMSFSQRMDWENMMKANKRGIV